MILYLIFISYGLRILKKQQPNLDLLLSNPDLYLLQHFREQRVDGRILALLSTDHLVKTLGMKLGPAVLLAEATAKKLQEVSKMADCEACRSIALSQQGPPMALQL